MATKSLSTTNVDVPVNVLMRHEIMRKKEKLRIDEENKMLMKRIENSHSSINISKFSDDYNNHIKNTKIASKFKPDQ